MNGIQSLMPGQAAPQGMPPGMPQGMPQGMQPQPSSPQQMMQSQTPMLKQLPKEQLVQLFAQEMSPGAPQKFTPLLILSAISDKVKQEQMQRAMQMQQVQQQNAQQPPGTVAQQVLSQAQQMPQQMPQQPVMAAHGGMMHSYAGGGAVAFRDAGAVPPGLLNPDFDEDGLPRGKDEREQIIDYNNKIRAAYEQQMRAKSAAGARTAAPSMQDIAGMMAGRRQLEQFYKPRDPNAYTPEALAYRVSGMSPADAPGRGMAEERVTPQAAPQAAPKPSATTFDISSPASINALRIAAQDTSLPAAERADLQRRISMMEQQAPSRGMQSGAPSQAAAPSANLSPEMEAYFRNRASDLRTRQGLPEDILAGRAGLEALARESIAAQRSEAEAFGREARERRDAALARTQRGILDDPQALLALAGSIDTRRGQGIGSLARGAAGMLGQREASAEAARKEYAAAQQTERMLQANVRQATILEAQRAQALRENDFTRANQIKDQIDALMMQRETLLMERKDKAIEQARLERVASAQELTAAKPTELELAMARPEEYARIMRQRAEAAQSRKSPEQIRKEDLERYADNWEKLDMMQKNELAKQGITNFQQYVRMRDQMAGMGGASSLGSKVMTMADVQATATASGKTIDEVRKAALAAGYTIQ